MLTNVYNSQNMWFCRKWLVHLTLSNIVPRFCAGQMDRMKFGSNGPVHMTLPGGPFGPKSCINIGKSVNQIENFVALLALHCSTISTGSATMSDKVVLVVLSKML